jgi:hypothetical protein
VPHFRNICNLSLYHKTAGFTFIIFSLSCLNSVLYFLRPVCRDNSVRIVTGYGLDDRGVGVRVPEGSRVFSTSSSPALVSTQPPIQWVPGVPSPGVKWPVREVDHSPPTSAEVKKMWIYTPIPTYALMAVQLHLFISCVRVSLPAKRCLFLPPQLEPRQLLRRLSAGEQN